MCEIRGYGGYDGKKLQEELREEVRGSDRDSSGGRK